MVRQTNKYNPVCRNSCQAKIYASKFTVGEIPFLFTTNDHLVGDDPFPLPDATESLVKQDSDLHGIWQLRKRLINVTLAENEIHTWTWREIESQINSMGFSRTGTKVFLTTIGEYFFHESCDRHIAKGAHRFEVNLKAADTTVSLWNVDLDGLFYYDSAGTGSLCVELPLSDDAVLQKLINTRQFVKEEVSAIQELYFAPHVMLAPLALIFEDFLSAV